MVPFLSDRSQSTAVTDVFSGYFHQNKCSTGQWYDTENLTAKEYPAMSVRPRRGLVQTVQGAQSMICRDATVLCANGRVTVGNYETGLTVSAEGEKQMVSMGAYVVIFPDKKYINTADLTDFGSLDNTVTIHTGVTPLTLSLCREDGSAVSDPVLVKPAEPAEGTLWLDLSSDTPVIYSYSGEELGWTEAEELYLSLSASGIGTGFHAGDGIEITGLDPEDSSRAVNKALEKLRSIQNVVYVGENRLVLEGSVPKTLVQSTGTVTLCRPVPDMDFVCQCGNRLWGCKYGVVGSRPVNEIYGCKLGDFTNWNSFRGLSTDSWAVSVGSDGPWTGAVCFRDHPIFFKENVMHTLSVSPTGAHSLTETVCRGVEKNSHKSLQIIDHVLYYKSSSGICAYDGALPAVISEALGEKAYSHAAAGQYRGNYYVSMQDEDSTWSLFTYDPRRHIWMRQDDLQVRFFANRGTSLLALDGTGKLWDLTGRTGTAEEAVSWEAVTGKLHWKLENRKYLLALRLRIKLEPGTFLRVSVQYDSDGIWRDEGSYAGKNCEMLEIPVIPRRCDHLQLRLQGTGESLLSSITWVLEEGGGGWE